MESEEESLLRKLEERVREALKAHDTQEVLKCLRGELWRLETTSLFATAGGILGAPDYGKVSTLIRVVKTVIRKVENGELKPSFRLVQTTFDGKQCPPFPFKPRRHACQPSQYREGRRTSLDEFV